MSGVDKNIVYNKEKKDDDYEIKKIKKEVKDKIIVVEYLKKQLEIKLDELEFLEEKIKSLEIKGE